MDSRVNVRFRLYYFHTPHKSKVQKLYLSLINIHIYSIELAAVVPRGYILAVTKGDFKCGISCRFLLWNPFIDGGYTLLARPELMELLSVWYVCVCTLDI